MQRNNYITYILLLEVFSIGILLIESDFLFISIKREFQICNQKSCCSQSNGGGLWRQTGIDKFECVAPSDG